MKLFQIPHWNFSAALLKLHSTCRITFWRKIIFVKIILFGTFYRSLSGSPSTFRQKFFSRLVQKYISKKKSFEKIPVSLAQTNLLSERLWHICQKCIRHFVYKHFFWEILCFCLFCPKFKQINFRTFGKNVNHRLLTDEFYVYRGNLQDVVWGKIWGFKNFRILMETLRSFAGKVLTDFSILHLTCSEEIFERKNHTKDKKFRFFMLRFLAKFPADLSNLHFTWLEEEHLEYKHFFSKEKFPFRNLFLEFVQIKFLNSGKNSMTGSSNKNFAFPDESFRVMLKITFVALSSFGSASQGPHCIEELWVCGKGMRRIASRHCDED